MSLHNNIINMYDLIINCNDIALYCTENIKQQMHQETILSIIHIDFLIADKY